ncbi:DUF3221 domain-containing protein [Robertmurraya yapensis]|uniref:DUF3221 domain-containing protein n=3 Tax=Bacillaceae TaxID=186817 RepID=A0A3S0RGX3_9BACI|nr:MULTISPECIES: DUF3221 domain-containing protein [Bacillaceae]RTR28126.1 DUF3221 domain-containing protein [Bacillus yapensis]TKC15152.1 DUF3221 domain-containing protein [Robertmurraya kyonggiensis]TKS94369.1 DUF3221 domain-containing protein [Bacillus yapensis]
MNTTTPYVRLMIASLLTLFFSLIFNHEDKGRHFSNVDHENTMVIEGYVISKRVGKILISEEPLQFWKIATGYITSNYENRYIIVKKHNKAANPNLLKNLKYNQKLRIYVDFIRESNPPITYAYYIEVIE